MLWRALVATTIQPARPMVIARQPRYAKTANARRKAASPARRVKSALGSRSAKRASAKIALLVRGIAIALGSRSVRRASARRKAASRARRRKIAPRERFAKRASAKTALAVAWMPIVQATKSAVRPRARHVWPAWRMGIVRRIRRANKMLAKRSRHRGYRGVAMTAPARMPLCPSAM